MAEFSRPESVLVVIFTPERACLLLQRVNPEDFWQSVTGALRWGETAAQAAAREVLEETGLTCAISEPSAPGADVRAAHPEAIRRRSPPVLVDSTIATRFPILPAWRARYAPGVKENLEHLWYLEVPAICGVSLNPAEHAAYRWLGLEEAIEAVASWTNREALERLR